MEILVERHFYSSEFVVGRCYLGDTYFCDTLEPPAGVNHPCIPEGEYPVNLIWSPRFNAYMPRLEGVPYRSGILIHKGNSVKDTLGSILVGTISFKGHLFQSSDTYGDIFEYMTTAVLHGDKIKVRVTSVKNPDYE